MGKRYTKEEHREALTLADEIGAAVLAKTHVDVKTLSQMLGHFSSGFTLDTYTHVTDRIQTEAPEKR